MKNETTTRAEREIICDKTAHIFEVISDAVAVIADTHDDLTTALLKDKQGNSPVTFYYAQKNCPNHRRCACCTL